MAPLRNADAVGRSRRARAGIRQFSRSTRDTAWPGSAPLALHHVTAPPASRATSISGASTSISRVTSTEGNTVEMTRENDSNRRTPTMTAASALSHGRLIHGPRTARALQSRTANTVELGRKSPARAWTAVVIRPRAEWGDGRVHAVGLLEEELRGGDGGPNDRDDQEGAVRGEAALDAGPQKSAQGCDRVGMAKDDQRENQQAREEEDEHRPLPAAEVSSERDGDQEKSCERNDHVRADSEVFRSEADANEFGADCQEVEQEEVADRKPTPGAPKPLGDKPGVANPGHGSKSDDHLLVDDEDRY